MRDLEQVRPRKRFATAQPDEVEPRQLPKNAFDFLERKIIRRWLLPAIAHEAPGVAREADDIGQVTWPPDFKSAPGPGARKSAK
jgi:hypothetical protein